jgi:hypothetical protein
VGVNFIELSLDKKIHRVHTATGQQFILANFCIKPFTTVWAEAVGELYLRMGFDI